MSFIAGAYCLDNTPVERSLLTSWQNLTCWADGPILFAQVPSQRPFFDPVSRCTVLFDGRLNDRERLTAALSDYPHLLQQQSDEALILAAYLHWGKDFVRHLLGDFAFALWNASEKELFLGRDHLGIRPLYYSIQSNYFVFASTIELLLQNPLVLPEIKEETALWYLYDGNSGLEKETFYKGVYFLAGGRQIQVRDRRVDASAYYTLPEHPPEQWAHLDEVKTEFRALLSKVIQDQTRGDRCGLMLSGGVDSSSIACVAADLKIPLHAYSLVFDRHPEMDERKYSTAVSKRYGFPHTLLPADDCTAFSKFNEWLPFFTDPCFNPFDATTFKIMEQAKSDGNRVMMMGHGGDHILNGNARYFAHWLLHGRWKDLHQQVKHHANQWQRSYARAFLVNALYPLSPTPLQRRLESRRWAGASRWVPNHLSKQYRFPRTLDDICSGPFGWWYLLRSQMNNIANSPHSHMVRLMELFGVPLRLPFLDIRLVEFILRTPPEAIYRNGMIKMILRESLTDLLPPIIQERRDKAAFVPLARAGLKQRRLYLEGLLKDSQLERRGYVNPENWKQDVHNFLQQEAPPHWAPWRSLTLEMWLRHREGQLPPLQ